MESKALIYAVDDIPDNADLLAHYLKPNGYLVEVFSSGEAVLAKLKGNYQQQSRQPDLILVDLMMPGINGIEVITQVKATKSLGYIPIVLVTAYSDSETRVKGLDSGADDFLSKPVNRSELIARVGSLVRLKQTYDEKTRLLQEVQNAYDSLNSTKMELIEAEKHKLQMSAMITTAAGICHEMSQPLTSALITLQIMRQTAEDSYEHDIEMVESSLLEARDILDKLRALTRYETKPYLGDEVILDIDKSSKPPISQEGYQAQG
jgi:DNA-binding response OmpR family regulator